MGTANTPACPVWLDDEPVVRHWLRATLAKLEKRPAEERTSPLRSPVNRRSFPELFHQGPVADATWDLIKGLKDRLPLRIVLLKKRDPFAPEYEGATIFLDPACEETLRAWLGAPRVTEAQAAWREAVAATCRLWDEAAYGQLRDAEVSIEGLAPDEVVAAFVRLGRFQGQGLSLRELSARAFFGDSKFIEQRCAALVQALYPQIQAALRPLLISVTLSPETGGVLFIENHDTYVRAVQGRLPATENLALVYAAGFLSGAARLRQRDGAVLHYHREHQGRREFEAWWFGEAGRKWPVWFFGDLDFEGLRILGALHQSFSAAAWHPGYGALLARLTDGEGHAPAAAGKANQRNPGPTGCPYADGVLLPALLEKGRFVDQESW